MQEVNSLCTDSQALRAEYGIVGIPQNTAIYTVSGKGATIFLPLTLPNADQFSIFFSLTDLSMNL